MATIKQLEKAVKELNDRIEHIECKVPTGEIHYACSDSEFGVTPVDVDTLRFDWRENKGNSPTWPKELTDKRYVYRSKNKIEHGISDAYGNIANEYIEIYSNTKPEDFEDLSDDDVITYKTSPHDGCPRPVTSKKLMDELGRRYFQAKKTHESNGTGDMIGEKYFKHQIRITFKNHYKLMPHIDYYFTPFGKHMVEYSEITEITNKYCIIELCYGEVKKNSLSKSYENGNHDMPSDLELHWRVQGIVEPADNRARDCDPPLKNDAKLESTNPFDAL